MMSGMIEMIAISASTKTTRTISMSVVSGITACVTDAYGMTMLATTHFTITVAEAPMLHIVGVAPWFVLASRRTFTMVRYTVMSKRELALHAVRTASTSRGS